MQKERLKLNQEDDVLLIRRHLSRYEFASQYIDSRVVLDIACGTGYGTSILASQGAKNIIGVDASTEAIQYANEHYLKDNIKFILGDAQKFTLSTKIDVAISFETIEHLKDPECLLRNVVGILKADGKFIISTPIRHKGTIDTKPDNVYHQREWNETEFCQLLKCYFKHSEIFYQYDFKKLWYPYSRSLSRFILNIIYPLATKNFLKYEVTKETPKLWNRLVQREYMIIICDGLIVDNHSQ
jgi:SAM-dependent methyltransferase